MKRAINPRVVLRYHGGKGTLARKIIPHFPKHRTYVEPFGGAASILLQKPRTYSEVYNDMDGDVVNVFRVMQDPSTAARLRELLMLTPFARDEFQLAYKPASDPIERARRAIVRSFMGFGSSGVNDSHKTGFRANSSRSGTTPAHDWMHYPDHVDTFTARLRGVVIENREARDVIAQHDSEETLIYADPPYPHESRKASSPKNYRHEMTDGDHARLSDRLHLGCRSMVIVSGYRCPLYEDLYGTWRSVDIAAFADGARPRVEVLWFSPNIPARNANLFEEALAS